jgi:hypothetical protein
MKVSPLQPEGIVFEFVNVDPELDENGEYQSAANFDFEGVSIHCGIGHGELEGSEELHPYPMMVSIEIVIDNERGQKKCPYRVRMKAMGFFKWLSKGTSPIERRDLIVVNGASMLYSASREMLLSVTSRCVGGPLTLPGFHFQDQKPSVVEAEATREASK